jgi:hypothetical protein
VIILGSKEIGHHFFSASKSPLILTSITTNVQIYRIPTLCCTITSLPADAYPDGKGCLLAVKLIKDLRNIYILKSYFGFYALFILCCGWSN